MKIAIIGAMEEEVELLREEIGSAKTTVIAGCEFIEGEIGGRDVVLVKSGIGKVNAAVATTLLLDNFKPDVVLNTGSAGGFQEALEVGYGCHFQTRCGTMMSTSRHSVTNMDKCRDNLQPIKRIRSLSKWHVRP